MKDLQYIKPFRNKGRDTSLQIINTEEREGEWKVKRSFIETKLGVVKVIEFKMFTRFEEVSHSLFSTIKNNVEYRAYLNEVNLSQRQLQWLSTNFMNTIFNRHGLHTEKTIHLKENFLNKFIKKILPKPPITNSPN